MSIEHFQKLSSNIENETFCSCVKKFLRALKEPVIPHSLWRTFVDAANNPDTTDAETALYQVRLLGSLSP